MLHWLAATFNGIGYASFILLGWLFSLLMFTSLAATRIHTPSAYDAPQHTIDAYTSSPPSQQHHYAPTKISRNADVTHAIIVSSLLPLGWGLYRHEWPAAAAYYGPFAASTSRHCLRHANAWPAFTYWSPAALRHRSTPRHAAPTYRIDVTSHYRGATTAADNITSRV